MATLIDPPRKAAFSVAPLTAAEVDVLLAERENRTRHVRDLLAAVS